MHRNLAHMWKKSEFWKHGKHAKVDPRLFQAPRRRLRFMEWFGSVRELMNKRHDERKH